MNKKKMIITIILTILILFGIYMLYNTFAISTIVINDSNNIYDVKVGEGTSISVGKGSNKTIYFHIENVNKGSIKYGVGYNTNTNIEVLVYDDSVDKAIDVIGYGENKFIKLYLNNPTDSDSTVTISTVLGYENGGDLIIPDGITLVEEVYTPPKKKATLAEYITNLYTKASKSEVTNGGITYNYASSENLMNDKLGGTTDSLNGGNIRYYGASPNNYIYFNCSDYNNQSDTTCELWRIIGVFDGKVKIMRNEPIGAYSWDTSASDVNSGDGENEWPEADVMKLLNSGYASESVGGSLYYNGKSGTCYSGRNNATTSCDFTTTGIKNNITRSKIAEVTWNLGGYGSNDSNYANQAYVSERGTTVYSGRSTTWTGRVALPYSSDYGYAADFNLCVSELAFYNDSTCTGNNWMYSIITDSGKNHEWLLTPYSGSSNYAWIVGLWGFITHFVNVVGGDANGITPTLFLNSTESIIEGTTGTQDNPYKLKLKNDDDNTDNDISIASYITKLYSDASKSTVENNSITYNYASSESLMNDRLGSLSTDIDGGNIRYYGASPNNYIYFNCEEYPDTNCEKWRIIGVFDGMVKIMKNQSIGDYSWDSSASGVNSGKGANEWSQADAMKLLNPGYESESVGGSLYYNSKSGTCYSKKNNGTKSCDFTSSGIKNDTTRSKIADPTWDLGGAADASSGYPDTVYQKEIGTTTASSSVDGITRTAAWNGKIALPYSSDYGYATDFNKCTNALYSYGGLLTSNDCGKNDWIFSIIKSGWLLTPTSANTYGSWRVTSTGRDDGGHDTYNAIAIVPTLFLKPTEIMVDGTTGTEDNPYKLKP